MATTFANLQLKRIIVHEVLLAADLDAGKNPQQSDLFLELDPKGETLLAKRLTDSLGSDSHSIELTVDVDREGSTFDLITKLPDAKDEDFISTSKELALLLTKAQNAGTIKAGICVVLAGTMGSNSSPSRFVAVLKAESDAGFVKEITKKAVLLKYISDMVLGAQQRLYKIGCFVETKSPAPGTNGDVRSKDDFEAIVYDHQMSNTGDNNAARYFYGTFLGCRLADNSQRLDGEAFVKTKRKLLEECNVYCIVSLPGGVFTSAGAGVKTNLVFFIKGEPTEKIWYYDLSDVKVGKKTPITLRHFDEFFQLLPKREDSKQSWTLEFTARLQTALEEARPHREKAAEFSAQAKTLEDEIRDQRKEKIAAFKLAALEEELKTVQRAARELLVKGDSLENAAYDLKAVNPNRVTKEDKRSPTQLLEFINAKGREADGALKQLQKLVAP